MDFGDRIEEVYREINKNDIVEYECIRTLPENQEIQEKLQKIKHRQNTNFTSTISDER
jgi:hypothetical protein